MHKLSLLLFLLVFVNITSVFAQKSMIYTHDSKDFEKALSLYKDKQYVSAQYLFDKVSQGNFNEELKSDCAYYLANCAIRTNQVNGDDLMEQFVANYPTSTKQNQAFVSVGHYFFNQTKYSEALQWFDKVQENQLDSSDLEVFNFQKGYCYFNAKMKKEATVCFNKVVLSQEYGAQAKYYLGFMAYEGDDYKEATRYFDAVSGEEKYKEKLSYFQADMNFKLGNFQQAIDLGEKAMPKSNDIEKSELNKIIGESFFNLKNYEKCIPFLLAYKGKKGKWNNTDFYQLGYAYYKKNDFESAISQFNKIIGGEDLVSQNAYYHLGESYLKTQRKQQALNAFKNASEMDFNLQIQEDAYLNYAKLSYDIGNSYQNVSVVLSDFISKYPDNAANVEIEKLLIDSYVSSKNYSEALVLLEKSKLQANKGIYQKVLFFRGTEFYTDGVYLSALKMFNKAIVESKSELITARATFWKGETEYVLEEFANAKASFTKFVSMPSAATTLEYKNCNYNVAYCYFKLKEYEQAGNFFEKQTRVVNSDKLRLADSYLRLADCRFVSSKYQAALDAYIKVIDLKSLDADYAYFQKALCYGFISKNNKKIEEFNAFLLLFPESGYRDDVLFELGNTYVVENNDALALKSYERLNTEFENSSFNVRALLRQGLVYYNADKDQQALVKLKKVVADYPRTSEALEAVATARLIYVDNGNIDEYANWVRTLDFVSVTDVELDNDTYEASEKQLASSNTKQAIASMSNYVSKFPKGIHALKANFQLAQLLYSEGLESKSVPNFEYAVLGSRNEFTEPSLVRLSQIFLKRKELEKAIPVLLRLENESEIAQNKTFSHSNLMKSYYDLKDYPNSVAYADKVIVNPKIDLEVKGDAQIIIARSALQIGDEAKAKLAYAKLQPTSKGELAAEAQYYDAYFKNKEGKFELSNVAVQKLAKNYSAYKYFGAKGLVVMAKNFYSLKDSFQATYILESVIQNFKEFTDVIVEAQSQLNSIKVEESKTNESIKK
jgi:tetratricopeptide (TPR) repeat protein